MYEVFLRELLEPLGIYDLSEESVSGAEIFALGAGLDTVSQQLERTEREALTATAQEEGLTRREALFARRPAADTPEERRKAIAEFYFRYLTWDECERGAYTWDSVEAAGFTWDTFQMSPPAEA